MQERGAGEVGAPVGEEVSGSWWCDRGVRGDGKARRDGEEAGGLTFGGLWGR